MCVQFAHYYSAVKTAGKFITISGVGQGMPQHILYQEVPTPFSVTRFICSVGGSSYGLAFTPEYFLHNRPGTKTEIRNLFLCGTSTRTGHGIVGAMTGGVGAAVDRCKLRYLIKDVGMRVEAQVSA